MRNTSVKHRILPRRLRRRRDPLFFDPLEQLLRQEDRAIMERLHSATNELQSQLLPSSDTFSRQLLKATDTDRPMSTQPRVITVVPAGFNITNMKG